MRDLADEKGYRLAEKRKYELPEGASPEKIINGENKTGNGCGSGAGCSGSSASFGCGTDNTGGGCGENSAAGGCGTGGGCGSAGGTFPKVQLLSDCRCIVCKKIGFNIQKQLEKLALIKITKLDIEIVSDRI